MATKKILITKVYTDVTDLSDNLIELNKAFTRLLAGDGTRVEFETIIEDEESDKATAERLLRQVRSEFKVADAGRKVSDEDDERTMDEP